MALSNSFRNLWKEATFRKRVTAVIIDEVSVRSQREGSASAGSIQRTVQYNIASAVAVGHEYVACSNVT